MPIYKQVCVYLAPNYYEFQVWFKTQYYSKKKNFCLVQKLFKNCSQQFNVSMLKPHAEIFRVNKVSLICDLKCLFMVIYLCCL